MCYAYLRISENKLCCYSRSATANEYGVAYIAEKYVSREEKGFVYSIVN